VIFILENVNTLKLVLYHLYVLMCKKKQFNN